jgi:hypothetical protein
MHKHLLLACCERLDPTLVCSITLLQPTNKLFASFGSNADESGNSLVLESLYFVIGIEYDLRMLEILR